MENNAVEVNNGDDPFQGIFDDELELVQDTTLLW